MSKGEAIDPLEGDYFEPGSCWITDMNLLTDTALAEVSTALDNMWMEIDALRRWAREATIFGRDVSKVMYELDELKKQAAMEWKRRQDVS